MRQNSVISIYPIAQAVFEVTDSKGHPIKNESQYCWHLHVVITYHMTLTRVAATWCNGHTDNAWRY
jgi:hypothetical protein